MSEELIPYDHTLSPLARAAQVADSIAQALFLVCDDERSCPFERDALLLARLMKKLFNRDEMPSQAGLTMHWHRVILFPLLG